MTREEFNKRVEDTQARYQVSSLDARIVVKLLLAWQGELSCFGRSSNRHYPFFDLHKQFVKSGLSDIQRKEANRLRQKCLNGNFETADF